MHSNETKNDRLSIVGLASLGVLMNLLTLSSSNLFRYRGGSLGLSKYQDGVTGERIAFVDIEDPALQTGRTAAVSAFFLGLLYLLVVAVHNFVAKIPCHSVLVGAVGSSIQLCLLAVYIAKNNDICDIEGCSWGSGATWLFLSELMILASCIGSLQNGGTPWTMNHRKIIRSNPNRTDFIVDY